MYRLFVAIDLPEDVRLMAAAICSDFAEARRVPADQLHLTLRFIGDADETSFKAIRDTLALVSCPTFTLLLKGVGCFPSPKRPRVLWTGVEAGEPILILQEKIERALNEAGLKPETRPFSPHITLARLKETWPAGFTAFQSRHASFQSPPFAVEAFHLYSSTLTPKGAIHRREATYPLTDTDSVTGY